MTGRFFALGEAHRTTLRTIESWWHDSISLMCQDQANTHELAICSLIFDTVQLIGDD